MNYKQKIDIYLSLLYVVEIFFIFVLLVGSYFFLVAYLNGSIASSYLRFGLAVTIIGIVGLTITISSKKKLHLEKWRNID